MGSGRWADLSGRPVPEPASRFPIGGNRVEHLRTITHKVNAHTTDVRDFDSTWRAAAPSVTTTQDERQFSESRVQGFNEPQGARRLRMRVTSCGCAGPRLLSIQRCDGFGARGVAACSGLGVRYVVPQ